MTDATHYTIRDREDRVVDTAPTMSAAMRLAKHHGPGSVVLGARGQVLFRVAPPKLPRDSGSTNVAANGQ